MTVADGRPQSTNFSNTIEQRQSIKKIPTSTSRNPSLEIVDEQSMKHGGSKRSREPSVEIIDARPAKKRPAKKKQRLRFSSVTVPLNDGRAYEQARNRYDFHIFCPLDFTNISMAIEEGYLNVVVMGFCWNTVIEALVMDEETSLPWQIPKITFEFKRIDYHGGRQRYTRLSIGRD